MQASWVISKITGNYNNTSNVGNSDGEYDNPNHDPRLQPFREGRLTNDNTHIAKVLRQLPGAVGRPGVGRVLLHLRPDVHADGARAGCARGDVDMFAEPRGSQRFDGQPSLDIKLEKQFRMVGDRRLGPDVRGVQPVQQLGESPVADHPVGRVIRQRRRAIVQRRGGFALGAVYRF